MKTIGIIGAMDCEVSLLRTYLQSEEITEAAGLTMYSGAIGSHRVILVKCGIGKVNAALCTQLLIDRFGVDDIINTGVAGGVALGLHVGDMVLATELVEHDMGLTPFGYKQGHIAGNEGVEPTYFVADPHLRAVFREAADAVLAGTGHRYIEGVIASGDLFINKTHVKEKLRNNFNAAAAEMEGAAIAHVAAQNKVPFTVVRAVSDLAEEGARESIDNFEAVVADISASIAIRMVERL